MNRVCPRVPPGAQAFYDEIMGYALWMVGGGFLAALAVSILLIVLGKVFGMRMLSSIGGVGILVTFGALFLYLILPGIMRALYGTGCF